MLDPTCGSGSAVRAAEITRGEVAFPRYCRDGNRLGRIQWKIRMLKLENLAGLMRLARKILF